MFRTITARFAGKCRRCGGDIQAGDRIRWAPGKGSYHMAAECPASPEYEGVRQLPGVVVSVRPFTPGYEEYVARMFGDVEEAS